MKYIKVYIILCLAIIMAYWLFYIEKIGLHGDEAYFGVDAITIMNEGITRPFGMNKYTGILQSWLNSLMFSLFDTNVTTLRLSGIFSNIIALLMAVILINKKARKLTLLIFLILFSQSVLLMGYSKIAWEVCSFNFLFISLSLTFLYKAEKEKRIRREVWQFLFLLSCLLGSYNHILFSSIVLALFIGTVVYLLIGSKKDGNIATKNISLLALACLNVVLLYYFMTVLIDDLWLQFGGYIIIIPLVLLLLEVIVLKRLGELSAFIIAKLPKSKHLVFFRLLFMLLGIVPFGIIHLFSVFDVLANQIVMRRLFSAEINPFFKWFFASVALLLIGYTIYKTGYLLLKNKANILTFTLIAYMGIFSFYTQGHSIRYYLLFIILLFFFLSDELSTERKWLRSALVTFLIISGLITQLFLWSFNLNDSRKVVAKKFMVGADFPETSAHFLNFTPVLNYVHKHKIGVLDTKQGFFINYVFKFYKLADPKIAAYQDTAAVNYDYETAHNGFLIEKFKGKKN